MKEPLLRLTFKKSVLAAAICLASSGIASSVLASQLEEVVMTLFESDVVFVWD